MLKLILIFNYKSILIKYYLNILQVGVFELLTHIANIIVSSIYYFIRPLALVSTL